MPIKGGYLLLAGGGAVIAWSGIRGKSWSTVLQDLIKGKNPKGAPTAYAITGTSASGGGGGPTGGGGVGNLVSIEQANMHKYHYVFGGIPANGVVDCSSYQNECATEAGLPIPGGRYNGHTHGPTTVIWRVWPGMITIPRNQAQPGDLVIWLTHMGMCVDNGQNMISALNPSMGIQQTPINGYGPAHEPMTFRRWK